MNDIAIIGIGCRFPGSANSPDEFWNLIKNGVDATTDVKDERWSKRTYYNKNILVPGKIKTIHGGFIDEIDKFDPSFFGISPKEANYMDPQQRILLEVTNEAMEDAGIISTSLKGKSVGVYVGAFTVDYKIVAFNPLNLESLDVYSSAGSMMTMLSNRLSYIYDLRGPSMTVDTACSSSLVAVHLACEGIENGDCEMAVVAGVNIMITPQYSIAESKGRFLSPDGRCKAFDSSANGYARGEGAGVVILKPLEKALADGDDIYSVIKATGSNQDGRTPGITVPNGEAQESLLRETCAKANISPSDITYMEAHGTGTPVGDPIEANAIGNVVKLGREGKPDCIIGSVKTNIGHLEAASGIAALIKVSLMLKNKKIPPHLHFKNPNPQIPFKKLRIKVNTELNDFTSSTGKLISGINSFGFGGTNANVILENISESETDKKTNKKDDLNIAIISGKSQEALYDAASSMKNYLSNNINNEDISIQDITYTLLNKRSHHECRLAFPVNDKEQMAQYLDAFVDKQVRKEMFNEKCEFKDKKNIVFVYTGMGPIWWAMGRELLCKEEVFKKTVEKCDKLIKEYAGWSILEKLLANEEDSELDQPQYAQPANFVLQVALTELWCLYGVEPNAIVGHSVGEVAAAYASGSLDLEQAVRVSIERSKAQQKMVDKGTMMIADISEGEAKELLKSYESVSIGVVNSDKSVTLSGSRDALEEIGKVFETKGIFTKFLRVNVAYHSYQMDVLKDDFEASIKGLTSSKPTVQIYSTVTGSKSNGYLYGEDYWWSNVRETVRFKDAIDNLLEDGYRVFVEIGPHPVLKSSIEECMINKNIEGRTIPSIIRKVDEQVTFYSSLAHIYTLGYDIDKEKISPKEGKFVKIPLYQWQNRRYWNECEESIEIRTGFNNNHVLGRKLRTPIPTWENEINVEGYPYLLDHKVQDALLFPGAGYLEMGLTFLKQYVPEEKCRIDNINFHKAMFLKENGNVHVQFVFNPQNKQFEIYSRYVEDGDRWTLNATGKVSKSMRVSMDDKLDIDAIKEECTEEINKDECYKLFNKKGFQYGPNFQSIEKAYRGSDFVLSHIKVADIDFLNEEEYVLHPTIIDGCFQGMISVMSNFKDIENTNKLFLPTSVDSIQVYGKPQENMLAYIKIVSSTEEHIKGNIILCDDFGNTIASIKGFTVRDADSSSVSEKSAIEQTTYDFKWYKVNDVNELGYKADELEENEKRDFSEKRLWIVFDDNAELGEALTKELIQKGQECINIIPGVEYNILNEGRTISINVDNEEDFDSLIAYIVEKSDVKIGGILHLWNLRASYSKDMEASYLQEFQSIGCMSIINFIKACEIRQVSAPIWIITRGVQAINGFITEQALPQSPVWGLGKVIGYQEYPDMFGSLIDLDPTPSKYDVECIISQIQTEDTETQVAFRGKFKYVPRVIKSGVVQTSVVSEFKSNKSYVITGAFGALGMLVAKWMVKNGARRLILFSRTEISERKNWNSVDKNTTLGKRIDFIKELEDEGVNVHLGCIDVSDKEDLTKYMNEYYENGWSEVAGVIHCAGVVRDKLLNNMDKATFDTVIKPKIGGAWNLHKVFEDKPLDFFILFSSVSSTINITMGQSNYASANQFMDILSSYRKVKGLPCISINWGPWSEVGMASENNLVNYFESKGIGSINPYQGMRTLDNILNYNMSQVIVLSAKWSLLRSLFLMKYTPAMVAYLCENNTESISDDNDNEGKEAILKSILETSDMDERKSKVREHLIILIAKIFGSDRNNLNTIKSLGELGMDSLMATDIRRNIELVFKAKISMVELMKGISVDELAGKLMTKISDNDDVFLVQDEVLYTHVEADTESTYEPFPLTDVQMAYFTGRNNSFVLGGVSTHMYMEMNSHVDIKIFNEALNKVIEIHPMLRTVFLDNAQQQILREIPQYKISLKDISSYSEEFKEREIVKMREQLSHKVFDPSKWPLFSIKALKISDEYVHLFIGFDMLITDGTSWKKVGDELSRIYYHPEEVTEKIDFTFKDYMRGYTEIKNSKAYEVDKKYWLDKIETFPKSPNVELKVAPKDINKPHFRRLITIFTESETKELKKLARRNNISQSVLFCTIYSMVLSYWSNQDKLAINVTVFNRYPFNEQVDKLLGDFTSLILLGIDFREENSFWDKTKNILNVMTEALEHKHFDGVEFIRELSKQSDIVDDIVMPVVFTSMLSGDGTELDGWASLGDIKTTLSQTPQVYLDNQLIEINGKLNIVLDYVENLFYEHDIANMYNTYIEIVRVLIKGEDITKIELVQEDRDIINNYNDTDDVINNTTLQQLFIDQAAKTPENIAVKFKDQVITYKELDIRSNGVSVYLRDQGVKCKDYVAVLGERCIDTIVNILGILKIGAAYVPIDIDCPEDRKQYIMENSNCKCMLTSELNKKVDISIYENKETIEVYNDAEDTAYVIYTSGSTGKPKGVVISHKAAVNTILDINKRFNVGQDDKIIGLSSMNFDLSVYDIFGSLSSGAVLVMVPSLRDIDNITDIIKKERITIWNSVPAIMDMLIDNMGGNSVSFESIPFWQAEGEVAADMLVEYDENTSVRLVMLSGDWIPLGLPGKVVDKFTNSKIISLGGATEASIWSIYYPIENIDNSWRSIPYGRPLMNQRIYILNNKSQICPINVQGEICIGGIGIATEYMGDLEKTEAAFIDHPTLGRLYKTGDNGILRREGYIEFLGRKDSQVKIKGNRIELGEIEHCLSAITGIKNAVVIDWTDKKSIKYLCAYVVSDEELNVEKIREHLSKQLSEYMIPAKYIKIDSIPLSSNGKVDRKLLQAPADVNIETKFMAPKNEIEIKLEAICRDLLGRDEKISIDESLYNLGWDSIRMISFSTKIKAVFGVELAFSILVAYPTIKNIGEFILNKNTNSQKIYTVLNEKAENKIFAFPPALTFGIAYKELSGLLNDHSIYAFDYINDEDIINVYAEEILKVQESGPYKLLGYSGGGSIAYEVAKELQHKGYEVSKIILMDTNYGLDNHVANMELEIVNAFKVETIGIVSAKLFDNFSDIDNINTDLEERIDKYLNMLTCKCSTNGQINADLYYIVADKTVKDYRSTLRDTDYKWKELTSGEFYEYQGYGSHNDMIFGDYVKRNSEIIKSILDKS